MAARAIALARVVEDRETVQFLFAQLATSSRPGIVAAAVGIEVRWALLKDFKRQKYRLERAFVAIKYVVARIPAIIVSPLAKTGTIDHTQYDTASVLRLITRRFGLDTLSGLKQRDDALTRQGGTAMGDLTNALNLN